MECIRAVGEVYRVNSYSDFDRDFKERLYTEFSKTPYLGDNPGDALAQWNKFITEQNVIPIDALESI